MKCIPMTLLGRDVAAAMSLMLMLLVLLARMVSGLQISSSSANVENFYSGISGMASTTRSASAAELRGTEAEIRESADAASSSVILALEIIFCNDF